MGKHIVHGDSCFYGDSYGVGCSPLHMSVVVLILVELAHNVVLVRNQSFLKKSKLLNLLLGLTSMVLVMFMISHIKSNNKIDSDYYLCK